VSQRVVVTGASGRIGGILSEGLDGYELVRTDRAAARRSSVARVDMTNLKAATKSFAGAEAVVDLAANASVGISWDEAHRNNLRSTMNALEAARRAGVRRVVYASSNHVTGLYELDEPYAAILAGAYEALDPGRVPQISSRSPIRPDSPYGVSKAFGEAAARYYAEAHDLSVICLRIGTVSIEGGPTTVREFATLLSHRDLVHLVDCCLRAPEDLRFGIFYGVSANRWRFWEIADAEDAVGYRPRDNAEDWR
jgi:NAD+ dependent glucose-6-phosphate dehydrogenase